MSLPDEGTTEVWPEEARVSGHRGYSESELRHGLEQVLIAGLEQMSTPVLLLEYQRDASAHRKAQQASALPRESSQLTVVWANPAVVAGTDKTRESILGRSLDALTAGCTFLSGTWEMEQALIEGKSVRTELRWSQAPDDEVTQPSERTWQCMLSPLLGSTVRGGELWWLQVVEDQEPDVAGSTPDASLVAERQEHRGLALLSQVSDFLVDLERPQVLGDIARELASSLGGWFGFYLSTECGVEYSESLRGSGSRGVRARVVRAEAGIDALGDSQVPGMGTTVIEGPEITEVQDPVAALVRGKLTDPTPFLLRGAYLPATVSRDFARDLSGRLAAERREFGEVLLYPLPGRHGPLGILTAVMPAVTEETNLLGMSARVKRADAWGITLDGDMTILALVARRIGMAIENVELHHREHAVAEALQRAMLPEQADVPGLDIWTYYAPAGGHAQVGGDWFDVLHLADHAAGVVIGDVVGHDIEAAATMGQLRSVIRAYAFELRDPAVVLERTDRLAHEMRLPRPASATYGTLTQMRTGWRLDYSRAGHLPAMVLTADTVNVLDGKGGMLLGYGRGSRGHESLLLVPGEALVLYTDGLIERRQSPLNSALTELREHVNQCRGLDAAGIGEELLSRLSSAQEDDVALVVVRVPPPDGVTMPDLRDRRARRWSLPPESASIARARHSVVQAGAQWGVENLQNAELVTSELVANAVLHGWGHLALRVLLVDDRLRIEVEDANPSPPELTAGHANRAGGFGMRIVDRLSVWGWEPTDTGKVVWAEIPAAAGA